MDKFVFFIAISEILRTRYLQVSNWCKDTKIYQRYQCIKTHTPLNRHLSRYDDLSRWFPLPEISHQKLKKSNFAYELLKAHRHGSDLNLCLSVWEAIVWTTTLPTPVDYIYLPTQDNNLLHKLHFICTNTYQLIWIQVCFSITQSLTILIKKLPRKQIPVRCRSVELIWSERL